MRSSRWRASTATQQAFHARYLTGERWRTAVSVLLSRTSHLAFYPASMFAQSTEDDLGRFFAGRFEDFLCTQPVGDDYFLSQLLFGRYLLDRPGGSPGYLESAAYPEVQRNLGKLTIAAADVGEFAAAEPGWDAFFLSNVLDWADEAGRERICRSVLAAARPGAVVLLRQMLSARPLPDFFRQRQRVDEVLSRRLLERERSMLYQRVVCGVIA